MIYNHFLIFKLIIIKKFESCQKLKCAQTLVLYSSYIAAIGYEKTVSFELPV